jgi:hypothetical protein
MFSERLENLIKATLQDGVLTEQEKATLIKRAEAEGEDIVEVDIYIQSLLQARQQELDKIKKKERYEREKIETEEQKTRDAIMRKCPVCGEVITGISNVCPHCNHVLVNTLEKASEDKLHTLMQRISKASTHLMWSWRGQLVTLPEDHYINKIKYRELEREGGYKLDFFPSRPDDDPRKYYWIEEFDYYFSDMKELEIYYGELPVVKKFIHNQKVNEISLLEQEIQTKISDGKTDRAKSLISTLSTVYFDVPEAKVISSNLEKQIAQSEQRKKYIIGGVVLSVIILLIALLA